LGQGGNGLFEELLDRGDLTGANGGSDRRFLGRREGDGHGSSFFIMNRPYSERDEVSADLRTSATLLRASVVCHSFGLIDSMRPNHAPGATIHSELP
jgi:hypothetical protein